MEGTGACGTAKPRNGLPIENAKAKFKLCGEYKCMTYYDVIISMRILDRKHDFAFYRIVKKRNLLKEKTLENKRSWDQTGNHSPLQEIYGCS